MPTNLVLADNTASISELKKNPMKTVEAGDGFAWRRATALPWRF
nr:hypothetical protein [Desulfonatronum sp. SC1]